MLDVFQLLNLTDGTVMFLSDSYSDGTHSHPLQRHIYQNLGCSKSEHTFICEVTIPLSK